MVREDGRREDGRREREEGRREREDEEVVGVGEVEGGDVSEESGVELDHDTFKQVHVCAQCVASVPGQFFLCYSCYNNTRGRKERRI